MPDQLIFDEALNMRRTATSAVTASVLKNPAMLAADYISGYRKLEERTGRRFPCILMALTYLPVVHDGEWHGELRRLASGFMQQSAPVLNEIRERAVRHVRRFFSTAGEADVMDGLVGPVVAEFLECQTGVTFTASPSLVFDHRLTIRDRLKLEAGFADVFDRIRTRFPDEDEAGHGIRLAFAILGNDATLGSLGNSFALVLDGARDQPVASLDWPEAIPATGVPFVLRRAVNDNALPDQRCPNETIQVDLASFLTDPDAPRPAGIFGAGAHACLGRGFMQTMWRDIVAEIRRSDAHVTFISRTSENFRIFDVPRSILVKVSR